MKKHTILLMLLLVSCDQTSYQALVIKRDEEHVVLRRANGEEFSMMINDPSIKVGDTVQCKTRLFRQVLTSDK